MDDVTNKRIADLSGEIAGLRGQLAGTNTVMNDVRAKVDDHHDQVLNRFREVELRLSTEVREVGNLMRDLKSWLAERDDTRQRLAQVEKELAQLRSLVGGGKS